jgi:hypothetical protein
LIPSFLDDGEDLVSFLKKALNASELTGLDKNTIALVSYFDFRGSSTTLSTKAFMSSGIFSIEVPIDVRDTQEVEDLDQIMRTWTCGGEVTGWLYRFKAVYNGKRSMDVFVFNHPQFINFIAAYSQVFAPLGISSSSKPASILNAVDSANRQLRHRGLGLLFGILIEAIDFFVAADARQQVTGK